MSQFIKRFFLLLLLALVVVPVLQARFQFVEEKPLVGAFTAAANPEFNWDALRDNSFQPALEQYLEDQIGFRPTLIRLRNQLAFSLFRVARSSDIVVGQNGVLFQPGPIQSYLGHDLLAEDEVALRVRRLRAVQRDLRQHGITFLFVLAPNKARFEPEDLPGHLRQPVGTVTNYERFTQAMRRDSVALLDMVPVFARWKATTPYTLFPRVGTHWSGYGATLAADTLLRRLEELSHLRFPGVRTLGPPLVVRSVDSLRGNDNDLGGTLNLFVQRETMPVAYRRLAFDPPQPGQVRPSALFVGDSFTWGLMLFSPYMQREFADDTRFWYYNNAVVMPDSVYHDTGVQAASLDLKQQVESRQFVILVLTEHNLIENEFGFTERLYHLYHPLTADDEAGIGRIAEQLMQQATWEEQTKNSDNFAQQVRQKAHLIFDQQHMK